MMRFGALSLIIITILLNCFQPVSAKKKKLNKVASLNDYNKTDLLNVELQINKTETDYFLEDLIEEHLGKNYKRANVYDLFPLELDKKQAKKLDYQDQVALIDYYNYARRELEKTSGSRLLKSFTYNFDGDKEGIKDYAVIAWDTKKNEIYLLILNKDELLTKESISPGYLEPINEGRFPTEVIYENNTKTKFVSNPALRVVLLDEKSFVLFYNAKEKLWEKLYLN
jgi:hypothetical protein